ncbi:MAG: transposase, partial [Bacteroidota bacterium]|nr:transposase [Bacteroidota bacterium]
NEEIEEGEYKLPEEIQDKKKLKEKIKGMLKEFEEARRENLNFKETDARIIKERDGYCLGYNAQAVVDAKHGILVGADVLNEENDERSLVPMIEKVKETTGLIPELTLTDSGYATSEQIYRAEEKGYKVLLNITNKTNISTGSRGEEPYHSSNFKYDEEKDVMICPESKELKYKKTQLSKNKRYEVREYKCENYKDCSVRWECSKSKAGRRVKLNPYYKSIKNQQEYQQIESNKEKLRKRKAMIEPVFGIIKEAHGFRRFTVKGLENVKAQWSLMCTTINLKRMYGLWAKGKIKLA